MNRRLVWWGLAAILVLQIFLRLPFLNEPLERDEGFYGYMGQRIIAGDVPYRDVFDHKPPALYYVFAAVIKVFGDSVFTVHAATLAYTLCSTLALFAAGSLIMGTGGGLGAALLYAVFSAGPMVQGSSSNTETFMVLPMVLALFFFLKAQKEHDRRWYFAAGLLSGLAFMFKQVAALNFLALLLFALSFDALWLIAGFLVFPLLFLLLFAFNGALPDFIGSVFIVNRVYLASSPVPFFFIDPRWGLSAIWRQVSNENGLLWALSILAVPLILVADRQRDRLLLVVWSLFSFLGVCAGTLFFGHYFIQLIPAFCLLSVYALITINRKARAAVKTAAFVLVAALALMSARYFYPFYFQYSPEQINQIKYNTPNFAVARFISLRLEKKLAPADNVFVWAAEPEVYFYLHKKAPSKYTYYIYWMKSLGFQYRILADVKKNPPRFLIVGSYLPSFPEMVEWAKRNYRPFYFVGDWYLCERKK